ncbi:MAG: hypothetical protein ACLVML_09070 [Candidatus Gastranaerophilaceae bacterium]|jgi:hypothetical protein|nr:hypothetical protein [Christensenellales bacterium]
MKMEFTGMDEYVEMLKNLGERYNETCKRMLNAAVAILLAALKRAGSPFSDKIYAQAPKKNAYGWWSMVKVKGRTSTGTTANRAATVYEHGRKEGKYKSRKGNTKHYPSQRKRPFIHKTVADCEPEVIAEMQKIYDEEAEKM